MREDSSLTRMRSGVVARGAVDIGWANKRTAEQTERTRPGGDNGAFMSPTLRGRPFVRPMRHFTRTQKSLVPIGLTPNAPMDSVARLWARSKCVAEPPAE